MKFGWTLETISKSIVQHKLQKFDHEKSDKHLLQDVLACIIHRKLGALFNSIYRKIQFCIVSTCFIFIIYRISKGKFSTIFWNVFHMLWIFDLPITFSQYIQNMVVAYLLTMLMTFYSVSFKRMLVNNKWKRINKNRERKFMAVIFTIMCKDKDKISTILKSIIWYF